MLTVTPRVAPTCSTIPRWVVVLGDRKIAFWLPLKRLVLSPSGLPAVPSSSTFPAMLDLQSGE